MLEPLLSKGKKAGRPPIWTWRQVIDGMCRVRTGIPWRDMAEEYGPWGRSSTSSAAGSATAPGSASSPNSRPGPIRRT
ncbi:transposase [Streptomyces sp. NPDC020800]|uniref:transposase n=1 Tax=Streptomyces sp. NPDC020800 TaxID=3365092 RepID=UPI0037A47201